MRPVLSAQKAFRLRRTRKLKQAQAAQVMGVSQSRVSDLLRGKLDLFSSDALIDMLARLGRRVRLVTSVAGSQRVAKHRALSCRARANERQRAL
jgi:transcriptional regulator with XRE-family HTH domain